MTAPHCPVCMTLPGFHMRAGLPGDQCLVCAGFTNGVAFVIDQLPDLPELRKFDALRAILAGLRDTVGVVATDEGVSASAFDLGPIPATATPTGGTETVENVSA